MAKLRFPLSFAVSGLLVLSLDAHAQTPATSTSDSLARELAGRNNRFGLELMAKLHKDGANLFLSPLSIASAL